MSKFILSKSYACTVFSCQVSFERIFCSYGSKSSEYGTVPIKTWGCRLLKIVNSNHAHHRRKFFNEYSVNSIPDKCFLLCGVTYFPRKSIFSHQKDLQLQLKGFSWRVIFCEWFCWVTSSWQQLTMFLWIYFYLLHRGVTKIITCTFWTLKIHKLLNRLINKYLKKFISGLISYYNFFTGIR